MRTKTIQWDFDAWEEYLSWQTHDKKMLKRIKVTLQRKFSKP